MVSVGAPNERGVGVAFELLPLLQETTEGCFSIDAKECAALAKSVAEVVVP